MISSIAACLPESASFTRSIMPGAWHRCRLAGAPLLLDPVLDLFAVPGGTLSAPNAFRAVLDHRA